MVSSNIFSLHGLLFIFLGVVTYCTFLFLWGHVSIDTLLSEYSWRFYYRSNSHYLIASIIQGNMWGLFHCFLERQWISIDMRARRLRVPGTWRLEYVITTKINWWITNPWYSFSEYRIASSGSYHRGRRCLYMGLWFWWKIGAWTWRTFVRYIFSAIIWLIFRIANW